MFRYCFWLFRRMFFQFLSVSKLYHQARRDYEILRNNAFAEKDGDLNIVLADGNGISQKGEQNGGVPDEEMLRMMNPEYSFWLHIPETEMDYPVVRGKDTSFYLNHSFEGKDSVSGVIFTDPFTEPFASGHTVLYGHNMKDGSMFGGLKAIWIRSFLENRPVFGFSGRENGLSALFFPAMWFRKMIIHRIRQG